MEQRTIHERPFILTSDSPENFRKSRAASARKFSNVRVSSEGCPSHALKSNQKQNGRTFQKRGKLFASPLLSAKICDSLETAESNDNQKNASSRSNLIKSKTKSVDRLNENVEEVNILAKSRRKIMRRSSSAPGSPKDKIALNFSIKVSIRIKPMGADFDDDRLLVRENNSSLNLHLSTQKYCFKFENIFDDKNGDPSECQKIVYEHTIRDSIESLLAGFNCCLMAYGPTGSGKTYSIMGTVSRPGIICRFCSDLFAKLNDYDTGESFTIQIAYYEIYNERIFDLLSSRDEDQLLKVRENPQTGPYVEGLVAHDVKSFDEIDILLKRGNARRTKAATLKNDQSSRSHAIFSLKLCRKTHIDHCELFVRSSSVCFVDLAGSEKIAAVVDLRETTTINKSLCFLSKVILQILKDYLGGSAKTHMLVTVRASKDSIEETLSTLRFASRAKAVICRVVKEEMHHLKGTTSQIEGLKRAASIGSLDIALKQNVCAAFTQTEESNDRVSALELCVGQFYVVFLTSTSMQSIDKSIFLLERQKSVTFGSNQFVDVKIEDLPPFCCKFSRDSADNVGLTWLTALRNRSHLANISDLDPAINGHPLAETCDRTVLRPKDCVRLNGEYFVLLWLPQSENDFVNYYLELESAKLNSMQNEILNVEMGLELDKEI
uniref:Kinesin-like protein n=1 Tax=Romanomermis culicivorax TaxID=13658 RepID=A0A915JPM7_ROMCU